MIQDVNRRLYTGVTTDTKRRLNQHNGKIRGGAKATRAGRPWILVHVEQFKTRGEAQKREAAIKKLPKAKKWELFN